jgi:oxygen-dependent protoporphyrinogen oxidase
MRNVSTIIIGGGISGASALHWLASGGDDVLLLEAADRLGGVIGSYRNDAGALVETGPNSTQLSHPQLRALIDELGLADAMMTTDARAKSRFVVRDGRLVATPSGPGGFLSTPLFSLAAKLRLLREPFIAPASPDREESIAQFVERRLGREFLDYAINPFVSGVYAGRPEKLSVRYAFPKLHTLEQEHGSLIRGALARRRQTKRARKDAVGAPQVSSLIAFREGMAMLPSRVAERWSDRVLTGHAVTALERTHDGWRVFAGGEIFEAARVVVATAARGAARLLEPLDRELARALGAIEYPPVATMLSLYRRDDVAHPLDGFGCLIPEVERRRVLGVIFSSTLFPNRAPDGAVAITTFIGGARQPEVARLGDDELVGVVLEEHRALLGVTGVPISTSLSRWEHAIPQYNVGYGRTLAALEEGERRSPGLFLLGNYRGGVSVGDCVKSASELASRLLAERPVDALRAGHAG